MRRALLIAAYACQACLGLAVLALAAVSQGGAEESRLLVARARAAGGPARTSRTPAPDPAAPSLKGPSIP